jgi:hypothetical protein
MNTHVARYGYSGTVNDALNYMIHYSSNEATGSLIQAVGGTNVVNDIIRQYLGDNMSFHLAHTPGYEEGGFNYITVGEEVKMLQLIEQGKVVNADASRQMLNIMYGTSDYFSLATIPGVKAVAQKTAGNPDLQFGIVAKIETTSGRSYTLAMQIWNKNGGSIGFNDLKDIISLIQTYFNQ